MATFEKRGSSQWRVKIRKKGYPVITQTFSKKALAERWARDVETSMDKGAHIDYREAEQTTLSNVLDRYEREILPTKKSQIQVKGQIRKIKSIIGNFSLSQLTSSLIAEYRDIRVSEVSNETVRKELLLIRRVLKAAMIDWGIHLANGNPVVQIRLPKPGKARERRLNHKEEEQLLIAAKEYGGYIHNIIVFAIETAMRRGEIVSIEWKDINFANKTLHIGKTKTDIPRTIPLSKRAISILESEPKNINDLVWCIKADSITQAFKRVCNNAEISGLRFHDLRHEATSRFFEKDLNIMEASSITGHKDLRMLKRYTHLKAENLVDKLQ